MKEIKTDVDLSQLFKDPVFEDYSDAIDFLTMKPDYSLLKFRDIITVLCQQIAEKRDIIFDSDKLVEQIEHLYVCQAIHGSFKSTLHQLRKLCNTGTHKPVINAEKKSETSNIDNFKKLQDKLLDNAVSARKLMLSVFEDAFIILNMGNTAPAYDLVEVGGQESKEILWQAATSLDWKIKLKAGLIYESLGDNYGMSAPIIVTSDFDYHRKSLYMLAAKCYEASFQISANVDKFLLDFTNFKLTADELIEKHSDVNALYHYATLAYEGFLGDEKKERGYQLLKIAADRGHTLASAEFGSYQYTEFKNYDLALHYLNKAANYDDGLAYCWLYYYYSEGLACDVDYDLALENLQKSLDLNCKLAFSTMGEAYHRGIVVVKDDRKANEYLLQGIEKGCRYGKRYYEIEYKDLAGQLARGFQSTGKAMLEELGRIQQKRDDNRPKPAISNKIARNKKCPCGSGKKYKRCCMVNKGMSMQDIKGKNIFEIGS